MLVKEGMATCGVCGRQFELKAEMGYIARDNGKTGWFSGASVRDEEQQYDAFDCPFCGCQNIVQPRKRLWVPPEYIEKEEEEPEQVDEGSGEWNPEGEPWVGDYNTLKRFMLKKECRKRGIHFDKNETKASLIDKLYCYDAGDDPDPGSPACEGTGPWCQVPCPGIEACPICQQEVKAEVKGYWTCEGQGRWCQEECPGPDKCDHRDPGPVFHEEAENADN